MNASSAHAEHVRWLALRLFDELGALLPESKSAWCTPSSRSLLEAAAVMHELIGRHGEDGMGIEWRHAMCSVAQVVCRTEQWT